MPKFLIISLKSRNEIYSYSNFLKQQGMFVSIVNSPNSIGSSCMLSIKLDYKYLNQIVNIINKQKPKSFLGLYLISQLNGNQTIRLMWQKSKTHLF